MWGRYHSSRKTTSDWDNAKHFPSRSSLTQIEAEHSPTRQRIRLELRECLALAPKADIRPPILLHGARHLLFGLVPTPHPNPWDGSFSWGLVLCFFLCCCLFCFLFFSQSFV